MPHRLGDDIDDFCIKCKRLTNHSIVSLMDERAAKVRCRTCYHDHDFRNEEPLPSKKDLKKAALLLESLGKGRASAEDGDEAESLDADSLDGDAEDGDELAEEEAIPAGAIEDEAAEPVEKKAAKKAKKTK